MLYARTVFAWMAALGILGAAVCSRAQQRAEGYIDTNFLTQCFGAPPRALAVQFDGKILVGGSFSSPTTGCENALDRLLANGANDNSFGSPFIPGDAVNAIALQSSKIIVAGGMRFAGNYFPLARLNANGSLDATFQRVNQNQPIVFNAILMVPEGILAVGDANPGTASRAGFMVRVGPNGGLIEEGVIASTTISAPVPVIAAAALAPGGKIFVAGSLTHLRGVARAGLGRLNADGSLDTSFVPDIEFGTVSALAVQPDGKVLAAGDFSIGGLPNRMLARFNANGTLDAGFVLNGSGNFGLSLVLQPDGKVILGHSTGVLRLETNGAVDTSFGPRNAEFQLGTKAANPSALALTANSNLLVGASSVNDNSATRFGVARLFAFAPPLPPPPFIVQQPLPHFAPAGTNVTFSVMATGAPPLSYQWRKNGTKINGATNSTYSIEDVDSTHTGNYTVVVSNPGGATTSTVARLTVSFQTSFLTIITNGLGAVVPNLTKEELEVGRTYTITARPAAGNLFSNWLGGVTSSLPTLTFVMESNLVLEVNFVPSPFIAVKGVYNGVFFNTDTHEHTTAGGFALTLDEKGGAKGSVKMGTKTRKFKGAFSAERMAEIILPATAKDPALTLALEADVENAIITGSVSFATNVSTNSSALTAYLNPFSSKLNPAPNAGLYNAAFPGADDPAFAPAGDGFAALTVSTSGRVSGKGTLADGTAVKLLSGTSRDGMVPVYVPLYNGRGSLFGWLTVTNNEVNDVSGTLWWNKPVAVGGAFYPGGFTNIIDVLGSFYSAPPRDTPVLTLNNSVVILSAGDLVEPLTNSITLGGDNKIAGDNQLTLTISPTKGTMTGSFVDPASNRKRTVKGIALPQQNQARGFFLGSDQSGRVFVGEAE